MRSVKGLACAVAASLLLVACLEAPPPPPVQPAFDPLFPDMGNYRPVNLPASACLTPEQIRAEQLIKVHTELMVTGLSCAKHFRNPTLFREYGFFTANNQQSLRDAQDILGEFLGEHERGNNARLFDTYRTKMANDESQLMIRTSQGAYCRTREQQYAIISKYTPVQMEEYLTRAAELYAPSYWECGGPEPTIVPASAVTIPAVPLPGTPPMARPAGAVIPAAAVVPGAAPPLAVPPPAAAAAPPAAAGAAAEPPAAAPAAGTPAPADAVPARPRTRVVMQSTPVGE